MSTAAVIIAIQNKIIRKFRTSGTTSIKSAKTLEELEIGHKLIFNKLVRKGVIVQRGDKFYLDEQQAKEFLLRRRRTAIIALALIIIGFSLFYLLK
jgi:hypothetical protein